MEFCNGKHICVLCNKIFNCSGVGYGHDNSKESNCHGEYEQFCTNHDLKEYIEYHRRNNEI